MRLINRLNRMNRTGINPGATVHRPINRAKNQAKARFIGRNLVAPRFISGRRWQFTSIVLVIYLMLSLIGCQTQEMNSQQATDNEELITEAPIEESTEPVATVTVTEPVEVEPVEVEPVEAPATNSANADVIFVRAVSSGGDTWTFHVTVEHPDTGWEDYADGWDVVLPDGTIVKPDEASPFTRLLTHPHENEQPFTRSQSNIVIPANITSVTVRAHDLVDGFGGKEVVVDLTAVSGTDFEVTQ